MTISLIFAILGLVCLVMAALNVVAPRVNLQAMGLAFWLMSTLVK